MKTALLLLSVVLCFSIWAATDSRGGVWTAELSSDGDDVHFNLFGGRNRVPREPHTPHVGRSTMGFELKLASLSGITAAEMRSPAANVHFSLVKPAGTLTFEGRFANGDGAGSYQFVPNEAFVRDLGSLGYSNFDDEELMVFVTSDFTVQKLRDLRALGYQPSKKEVIEIAIFDVNADFVRSFRAAGYPSLSLQELVEFRVGKVTPSFVREMRELGYANIPARRLAGLAIIGVTPAYIHELQAAGLTNLSAQETETLRVGRITAATIESYKRIGYSLTPRELGDFGIHKITPELINELRALGYTDLRPKQLIEMKIFGVTPEFIRKVEANGYKHVPVDKLIKIRMAGAEGLVTGEK